MHPALDLSEGRLFLRRGGEKLLPFFYCAADPDPERVRRFREAGVTGVSFITTADFHPYGLAAPAWLEDGRYDWTELDRRARASLEAFPDAVLLPRVHLCSPPWWDAAHPRELVVWDGDVREHDFLHGYRKRTCASWSSRAWRSAAASNLEALLVHARKADWGKNVGGVVVAGGNTEEWFQVGTMEGLLPDYSEPALEAFAGWLDRRGLGPEARAARWGAATGSALLPPPARRRPKRSSFRDPVADRWAMDFEEFLSEEAASFIGDLCGVVHDVSHGSWFAGAFYGYLVEMPFHGDGVLHGGHLGLARLLADDRVDFLASPGSYARRDLRRGATQSMLPVRAVMEAGKAVFHENDVRTHVLFDDAGYGWTERSSETDSAQEREAAFALASGAGLWWFDMTGTFYSDPATTDSIAKTIRVAAVPRPPRAHPPVAFVIDEESFGVTDLWPDRYADLIPRQLLELARVGCGYDVRLAGELPENHGYAMLVFPNLFRVEGPRIPRLRQLAAGARAALFIGPVGLAPVASGAPRGPAAVTGLTLAVREQATAVEVLLERAVFGGEPDAPRAFGRRFWHERTVFGDPARVRVLGRLRNGLVTFCDAEVGGTRVAWAADAVVPAAALRVLARDAGVVPALETGDVFVTDGSLCSLTASSPGVRRVAVPPGASATWDGSAAATVEGGAVIVPVSAGQTRTFVVRRSV
jgi:hypothetical protein